MESGQIEKLIGKIGYLAVVFCTALTAHRAEACTVCFGDPESSMAKGAVAGVFVLVGVVGFVLLGMAGTGLFWLHRGKSMARGPHTDDGDRRPETTVHGKGSAR